MTHDALAWEERPLQVCHLLHRSLNLDTRALVWWAAGILSTLHATSSAASGALLPLATWPWASSLLSTGPRLALGILLKCSF